MNIFYFFKELDTPMYRWQRIHLIDELQKCGHKIIVYNPLDFSTIEEANEKVLDEICRYKKIDLFLSCVGQNTLFKETIGIVKSKGIPTCMIAWDNLELPYIQKEIAPLFDIVWLTSHETQYLFEQWGCKKIVFATYAANPYVFTPHWDNQIPAVGFIGSPYGSRVNKLNELLHANINCQVYSDSLFQKGYNTSVGGVHKYGIRDVFVKASRYMRFPIGRKVLMSTIRNKFISKEELNELSPNLMKMPSVSDAEMVTLYGNLTLALNITELRDTYICKNPIHKIHLRAFEIPMSGGLEFASYSDELASYFENGKEIVLYRSKEEMIDKAKFYLAPQNSRIVMKMKQAARKRAENEHTWKRRFDSVMRAIQ